MPTQIFGGSHDGGAVTSDARIAVGPTADVPPLLERESELLAIGERLRALRDGVGSVLLIEGEAGIGKSSLLRQALGAARHARLDVLVARGGELERNYPFGLVLDLFGSILRDERDRDELLRGPADLARPLFETARASHGDPASDPFPTLHGLFWLTVNAAERGPLVLIVDDAHWADDASLAYLHYLAQRIDQLAVMLVVAFRSGEAAASERQPLMSSDAQRLRPAPLSLDAIAELAAVHGTDATADVAQRTWEATRGNPFFATELLRDGAALVATGPATAAAIPDAVSRAIVSRLGRLGSTARRIAEAGAVLEEHATLDQVSQLAEVDAVEAAEAVRALVKADILDAEQWLAFVHPIVREAVYAAMPGALRARLHRRAAKLLQQASAPVEAQAIHLLASEPAADPDVVEALCRAAGAARAGGATELAVTYLRRALREPPGDEATRASVLLDLARADAALGSELTDARYREALELIADPADRAQALLELGHALVNAARWDDAVEAFARGMTELGDRDDSLRGRLEAGFVSAAFVSVTHRAEAERLVEHVVSTDLVNQGHRELAAWVAFQRTAAVNGTADEAAELVERTIAAPIDELVTSGQLVEVAAGALLATDRLEREVDFLSQAIEAVERAGSQAKFGTYSYCRAWPLYYMGRLDESIADAQAALSAHELGWETFYPATCSILAWAHLERGEIEAAERVIDIDHDRWSARLDYRLLVPITRGRIALERGRYDDAVAELELAREGGVITGLETPVPPDWRTWLAITLTRLGRRDDARRVATEGLELAERWGARWPIGVALRAAGLATDGAEGIELLRRSVAALEASPARLELARSMMVLGELLRRAGASVEAREKLAASLDLAHRLGAHGLAERARGELVAAGVRPRRHALTGVESLTPSELRVARLAAAGRTNREVAQALFVTPKAIEYHLANAYRKLGIRGRPELARALETAEVVSV